MIIDLYNFDTDEIDNLDIDSNEKADYDYKAFIGDTEIAANLYKLHILNGDTPLIAAIKVLEKQL